MTALDHEQLEFLHSCARYGPTDFTSGLGHSLERQGYVEFVYEGASLQGRWRLTAMGRDAVQAADRR